MKRFAIIPAGGSGKRLGFETPKQFLKIGGKEIILHTLEPFFACEMIDEIIIAVSETYFDFAKKLFSEYRKIKPLEIVIGGKERQDSVFAALSSIENAEPTDFVVVHDAARAFLDISVLKNALEMAKNRGNAVVAIPARDTLAEVDENKIENYSDRSKIYYVQTPQIFTYKTLMNAMLKAKEENYIGTDESMLVKRYGERVFIAEGSSFNFKITTKEDLELAKKLIDTLS